MATDPLPLDISEMPEILRVAEEVNATGEPRILRIHNRDIALVTPIAPENKSGRKRNLPPKTKEQMEAFWSAAGAWKNIDTEAMKAYIYEGRKSSKPPVDL